jgi:hypothetical protein
MYWKSSGCYWKQSMILDLKMAHGPTLGFYFDQNTKLFTIAEQSKPGCVENFDQWPALSWPVVSSYWNIELFLSQGVTCLKMMISRTARAGPGRVKKDPKPLKLKMLLKSLIAFSTRMRAFPMKESAIFTIILNLKSVFQTGVSVYC